MKNKIVELKKLREEVENLRGYKDKVEELREQVAEIQDLNNKVEDLRSMISALQELVRELTDQARIGGGMAFWKIRAINLNAKA